MLNRGAGRLVLVYLTLVLVVLVSGCSSGPNPALNLGGIDIEEVFNGQILRVKQIMGGVNSLSSVDKAAEELQTVSYNMDDLVFNSAKLSDEGQIALGILAMKAAPEIGTLVDQVNSSPVTEEKLGGVLGDIHAKILSLI